MAAERVYFAIYSNFILLQFIDYSLGFQISTVRRYRCSEQTQNIKLYEMTTKLQRETIMEQFIRSEYISVQNVLWFRIIMIQIESKLTYPNYSESCRTQLTFVTSQNRLNCHKQTTSYVYVHTSSAMFSTEESDCRI